MSILNKIFGSNPNGNQPQQQPQGQQPTQQTNATPLQQQQQPAGQQPTTPAATPPAPESNSGDVSPLDAFKDLWNTDPNAQVDTFDPSKMFQIDPEKINQAVTQFDFAKAIPADALDKIASGGDDAKAAFVQAMNAVTQQAFAQSMIGNANLVQQALTNANSHLDRRVQDGIRRQGISSAIRDSNPALKHEAAAPIVSALEQAFANKYPNAQPKEVSEMASKYLSSFADIAAGKKPEPTGKDTGPDWEAYFNAK